MAKKQSKRQRKFQATGGISARLEKGTVASKGRLKKKRRKQGANKNEADAKEQPPKDLLDAAPQHGDKDDILSSDNVADLDLDAFFSQTAAALTGGSWEQDDAPVAAEEEDSASFSDSDDDSDEAVQDTKPAPSAIGKKSSDKKVGQEDKATNEEGSSSSDDDETSTSSSSSSSSSDSESDDDDNKLQKAEARMKAEMKSMQKTDPDFHQYLLAENEQELLEFGQDEKDDDASSDDSASDDDEENQDDHRKESSAAANDSKDGISLTAQLLQSLEHGAFGSHGIKPLKKLVCGAYRSACHWGQAPSDDRAEGANYVMESSEILDQLMVTCLEQCGDAFRYHLLGSSDEGKKKDSTKKNTGDDHAVKGDEEEDAPDEVEDSNKPINPKKLESAPRWNDLRPILLSFFRSTLHLLNEAKEPKLLAFVLKALRPYIPFLTPFPRMAESLLKTFTSLWSAPLDDSSEDYQVVRLHAFFRIRQLALTQPFPFIEDVLKKTYLAYAQRAKFGTGSATTHAALTFLGNSLVELYSLDYTASYQHAFIYIRQLALHLRMALQKKTPEAFQNVYCWQYLNCCKLWVAFLASACPQPDSTLLQSLVFPVTEILLGTVRLAPHPVRHLPLRFHCVRLLQQLAAAAEVFVPTANLLLDTLDWKEWYAPPKLTKGGASSSSRVVNISLLLKLPKDHPLQTHEQLEAATSELFLLLRRDMELYRYSPGFPEYSVRIVQRLKRYNKDMVHQQRWRSLARGCIETCERYAAAAVKARAQLPQAPKDVDRLEFLLPPSAPTMRERHQASIEKEQQSLEGSPSPREGSKSKSGSKDASRRKGHPSKQGETDKPASNKKRKKASTSKSKDDPAVPVATEKALLEQADEVREGIDDWSSSDED